MHRFTRTLLLPLVAGAAFAQPAPSPTASGTASAAASAAVPQARLAALAQRYFDAKMDLDPLTASGIQPQPRHEGRLEVTIAPESIERARALYRGVLRELREIPPEALDERARLDHELLRQEAQDALDGLAFPAELLPIDQFGGVPLALAQMAAGDQAQPLKTPADFEHFVQRLARLPAWSSQATVNMKEGLRRGIVLPRPLVDRLLPILAELAQPDLAKSPWGAAVRTIPADFTAADRSRTEAALREVHARQVQPAMAALHAFVRDSYRPAARETAGLGALPGGAAWYAQLVRSHTTTAMTPQAIHELGLAEVARIRGEIAKVQAQMGEGARGSVTDFLRWHAQQPRFRPFVRSEQILARFRATDAAIAPKLAALFGRAPKIPLQVREMPELQRATASPYYNPGTLDGKLPGVFYVGAAEPAVFNDSIVTALTLHEGQPGHHYQMSIQQELPLADFRRHGWNNAFGEGWALYAESLGEELGLYADPNQRLGFLKMELLRAVRLVADTGLHAFGWSRERSMQYMMETEGASERDARMATERYMAVPGQALAYKIGALRIQALRAKAQGALGERFSLREFHDLVLAQGMLPLAVLDRVVEQWIATKSAGRSEPSLTLARARSLVRLLPPR